MISRNSLTPSLTQINAVLTNDEDCGCASTLYSGKPSEIAKAANPRQAIRKASVFSLDDKQVVMDDLLEKQPVSIVVFLRSLGWPLCQEFVLQWSKRVNELEASGIKLVMVSIGTPTNGKKLADHLEIPNLSDFLFVDPENALYDSLHLNKSVKATFFSPGTPFAFLKRFTERDGMKELNEVLSKWNKGMNNCHFFV